MEFKEKMTLDLILLLFKKISGHVQKKKNGEITMFI